MNAKYMTNQSCKLYMYLVARSKHVDFVVGTFQASHILYVFEHSFFTQHSNKFKSS